MKISTLLQNIGGSMEHVYTAHFSLSFVAYTLDILQLEQSCQQMNYGTTVWV